MARSTKQDVPNEQSTPQIERLDERDIVFARALLVPGSKEYQEYYRKHRDLEEKDKKLRVYFDPVKSHEARKALFPDKKLAQVYSHTALMMVRMLADKVFGPVTPFVKEKFEVSDPVKMATKIKQLAKWLGADEVRIAELNQKWVYSHVGRAMYGDEKWGDPVVLPHKYAIVFSFPMTYDLLLGRGDPGPANFMDIGNIYVRLALVAVRVAAIIRDMGYDARAQITSNYRAMLVPAAIDAGLGELCRIGILLTKKYGPAQRLAAVTTELPLAVDKPADIGVQDFCSKCTKCADACPAGAIPKGEKELVRGVWKWNADGYKCCSYWNRTGISCCRCMAACPWTKPRTMIHRAISEIASRAAFIRPFLIQADNLVYGKEKKPRGLPDWLEF